MGRTAVAPAIANDIMKKITYLSTNRELPSGFREKLSFREALFMGQAPDQGLFMPSDIPGMSPKEIISLRGRPYAEVALAVLGKFLSGDIAEAELQAMTADAYDYEIPIERIDFFTYLLRLDRGPTASFKDFAARFMALAMKAMKVPRRKITVLVATSGDTGSAVGEAFRNLSGIRVYILYPEREVTPVQKKQLDSIGRNVQAIAVEGKFDDCQRLVKEAFSDPKLLPLHLTSANSINIGRILPQIVYYFYAYANVAEDLKPLVFSIPSGNFGNSLGCELARRMGLPIRKIIVAVNENDEFPYFLNSGEYNKVNPARACLSNAMNVGHPSNLARYFDLYGGTLDKNGVVHRAPDLAAMRKNLYSVSISDKETTETMVRLYQEHSFIVEPHGAVGLAACRHYFESHHRETAICLETAHPYKFASLISDTLGIALPPPKSMKKLNSRRGKADRLKKNYPALRKYLLERL